MTPSPLEALKTAVERAGGQSALARICGVRQPSVWNWIRRGKMSADDEMVIKVEAATGVSRHHLRPDIYPVEHAAPRFQGVDQHAAPLVAAALAPRAGNRRILLDSTGLTAAARMNGGRAA